MWQVCVNIRAVRYVSQGNSVGKNLKNGELVEVEVHTHISTLAVMLIGVT